MAETNSDLVAGFRRLRPVVHEWLARDLTGAPMEYTRALADLMFAYGFARLGSVDDAVRLVEDASHALSTSANEAHAWLLRMFQYRIDEALAGRPNSGMFPEETLPAMPERMEVNDPIKLEIYATSSAHRTSRILDPFGVVDPYAEWTKTLDATKRRVHELSRLRDPAKIADQVRVFLDDAVTYEPTKRAGVWRQVLPQAARAGHGFVARLLMEVPFILFESLRAPAAAGQFPRDLQVLIVTAINQAAAMPDGELFPPLIDSALAVIRTAQDEQARMQLLGEIGWSCLRWFRRLGKFDSASDFLIAASEWWPGTAWDSGEARLRESEEPAVFAATAEAAFRHFVSQPQAGDLLEAVVRVSSTNRLSAKGLCMAFTGSVSALAIWPTDEAIGRIAGLLRRVNRVSNTWQTAAYYSRFHLQMAESIVLAFPEVRGI